jgi:hypothetical protein
MLNYFSVFPVQEFTAAPCSQSFFYKRPDLGSFSLSFCLPLQVKNFSKGWNTFDQTTKF